MISRTIVTGLVAAIRRLENAVVTTLLGGICLVMVAQVVFRFVLKTPLAWSDELATYSFVWLALLGSTVGVRENAHIGVDAVVRLFPLAHRRRIAFASLTLIAAFLVVLVKLGLDLLGRVEDQRSAALGIAVFWVYLAVPVTAALMVLHLGVHAHALYHDRKAQATAEVSR